jgi:hypothetical protein
MMMHDFQTMAASAGMNIMLFNYRGVHESQGRPVTIAPLKTLSANPFFEPFLRPLLWSMLLEL